MATNTIDTGAEKSVVDLMEHFKQQITETCVGEAYVFVILGASVS